MEDNKNIKEMGPANSLKNGLDEKVLEHAVSAATISCAEIFDINGRLEPDEMIAHILNGTDVKQQSTWQQLIQKISSSPPTLRQYAIIYAAGHFHDFEIQDGSYFVDICELYSYTHWWLIGVKRTRELIKVPEVEAVLKELQLFSKDELKFSACPHNPMQMKVEPVLGKDFDLLYQDCSWQHQKEYGITAGNLKEKIMDGRKFYPYLPDTIGYTLQRFPDLAAAISRQISENVELLPDEDGPALKTKKGKRRVKKVKSYL